MNTHSAHGRYRCSLSLVKPRHFFREVTWVCWVGGLPRHWKRDSKRRNMPSQGQRKKPGNQVCTVCYLRINKMMLHVEILSFLLQGCSQVFPNFTGITTTSERGTDTAVRFPSAIQACLLASQSVLNPCSKSTTPLLLTGSKAGLSATAASWPSAKCCFQSV